MKKRLFGILLILSGLLVITNDSYACNTNPNAILTAFREYVIVNRSVILDGSASFDENPGDFITKYEWDFTNNSSYDYNETSSDYGDGAFDGITTHTYDSNDTYTALLRVTDNHTPAATKTEYIS